VPEYFGARGKGSSAQLMVGNGVVALTAQPVVTFGRAPAET
jgi:hypothetical protein